MSLGSLIKRALLPGNLAYSLRRLLVVATRLSLTSCLLIGCGGERASAPGSSPNSAEPGSTKTENRFGKREGSLGVSFSEIQGQAGLSFEHRHGGFGERFMIETMGSGVAFFDYDRDGWLDIYLVQSGAVRGSPEDQAYPNHLYQNRGDGTFVDVTESVGVGDTGYGMGTCVGDVNNDGWADLYLTNFGPDRLYLNEEGKKFRDATGGSGIHNPRWASSCAFADYDQDGCLDLYVVNYVDFRYDNHRRCGPADARMYCHPDVYEGVPDLLYRGRCDGTFEDVTEASGVRNLATNQSKGLGAIWTDQDDDGDVDLYVTNDSTRNFLYRNEGDGTFREIGSLSGTAFNDEGATEAGMGVDAGDVDGDGDIDLVVTNLDFETNTLYRNQGAGLFVDATTQSRLSGPSRTRVGFGIHLLDGDNDGDLDLFVANGHILDNIAAKNSSLTYPQADQYFDNDGRGVFSDTSALVGPYFQEARVGRGSAVGDIDNDGDLDLLIANSNQAVVLLENRLSSDAHWIQLDLRSRHGCRSAVGAKARMVSGGWAAVAEVRAGSGYQSQSDSRLHFGLGQRAVIDNVEVRWPNGEEQMISGTKIPLNQVTLLHQPGASCPEGEH